jgi:hypothetical protein
MQLVSISIVLKLPKHRQVKSQATLFGFHAESRAFDSGAKSDAAAESRCRET